MERYCQYSSRTGGVKPIDVNVLDAVRVVIHVARVVQCIQKQKKRQEVERTVSIWGRDVRKVVRVVRSCKFNKKK